MGDSSVATKSKKKNPFKSLGKGLSRKKKKQRPDDESVVEVSLARNPTPATPAPKQRMVSFDENNAYTPASNNAVGRPRGAAGPSSRSAAAAPPPAKPIQVVLLLMDPNSRRFELLQLEFDSSKAMVRDVLRQIQCSATETTLRDMTYAGVCDQSGVEMIASYKLSKFCEGNDVVMAMPKGMTGSETAKLAGPILGDPKVEDMLAPCGVKVQAKPIVKGASASILNKISEEGSRRTDTKPSSPKKAIGDQKATKTTLSNLPTALLGIAISSLLFFTIQRHVRVTKPLESGDVLLPGQWKSQCGIFDLFPEEWLDKFPLDEISPPSCDMSSSSMLELGKDGTLRYFTKDAKEGERKETWSAVVGGGRQCVEGEENDDEECVEKGATFVKEGPNWYLEMDGSRTWLNRDVMRDFTTEVQPEN